MTHSMTSDQCWQQALDSDDVHAAFEHFSEKVQELRDVRLAQALASPQMPNSILHSMAQNGCFNSGWMARVMEIGLVIDWGRALEWREAQAGPDRVEMEMKTAIDQCMDVYTSLKSQGSGRLVLEAMLVGMLEFKPSLAQEIYKSTTPPPPLLFSLSASPISENWLERSGLDVAGVLMAGLRAERHQALLNPWDGDQYKRIGWKMEAWLARSATRQQAWDYIRCTDQTRTEQERDWISNWLPEGQWEGAPLDAWASNIMSDRAWTGPSPLEHPALLSLDNQDPSLLDPKQCASDYIKCLGYSSMEPIVDRARKINNIMRERSLAGPENFLLKYPPDYLVASLAACQVWIEEIITSEEGAKHLQGIMKNDRRAGQAAVGWGAKSVMEWTLKQPLWQTWRDSDGNSLLANTLIALASRDNRKPSSRSKVQLMKLLKLAPGMLLDPNAKGQRLLDLMELQPATHSSMKREMLKLSVKTPVPPTRPRHRAM